MAENACALDCSISLECLVNRARCALIMQRDRQSDNGRSVIPGASISSRSPVNKACTHSARLSVSTRFRHASEWYVHVPQPLRRNGTGLNFEQWEGSG